MAEVDGTVVGERVAESNALPPPRPGQPHWSNIPEHVGQLSLTPVKPPRLRIPRMPFLVALAGVVVAAIAVVIVTGGDDASTPKVAAVAMDGEVFNSGKGWSIQVSQTWKLSRPTVAAVDRQWTVPYDDVVPAVVTVSMERFIDPDLSMRNYLVTANRQLHATYDDVEIEEQVVKERPDGSRVGYMRYYFGGGSTRVHSVVVIVLGGTRLAAASFVAVGDGFDNALDIVEPYLMTLEADLPDL